MNPDFSPNDHSLLDYRHIAEMGLEVAEYLDLVQDVTDEVPHHLADLHRCIVEQDQGGRRARIHQTYGMLVTFGFRALAERVQQLRELECENASAADALREQLELLWQQSLAELKVAAASGRFLPSA